MKSERKELNKKNVAKIDDKKLKKSRKSVDTKNIGEENEKLPNLENKKSKKLEKSEIKEKLKIKSVDGHKKKLKTTPVDELIDETIKDATNLNKKLNNELKKNKKLADEPKKIRKAVDELKTKSKNKTVDEPKKEVKKKTVDELIDETLLEINIESNNDLIEGLEDETMNCSTKNPIKVPSVKKNIKLTKKTNKSIKESVDESIKTSTKTIDQPDLKPIKKAIDEPVDTPSKKLKKNNANDLSMSNKTDHDISDSKHLKEEVKTNPSNKKSDRAYKLKISKNSIKMKNIESMYPNNIGVEETKTSFLILYKNAKTAKKDLRINEKYKFYNDKLIISNFGYKENEESIKNFLSDFGEVVDISLEKNKDDVFTGKAVVTFESSVKIDKELKLNNKILRVERIRKQAVNDKRIFIGRIDMNLSIMDIRKVLKETGARVTDVRIRYEKDTHKNIGYGHLSFKTREDAIKFESNFQNIKKTLGPHSFYEYAKEKFMASRKK